MLNHLNVEYIVMADPEQVIPEDYLCPIMLVVMRDPVIIGDGFTFERLVVEEWLRRCGNKPTNPLTGEALVNKTVVPNRALHNAIAVHMVRYPELDYEPVKAEVVVSAVDKYWQRNVVLQRKNQELEGELQYFEQQSLHVDGALTPFVEFHGGDQDRIVYHLFLLLRMLVPENEYGIKDKQYLRICFDKESSCVFKRQAFKLILQQLCYGEVKSDRNSITLVWAQITERCVREFKLRYLQETALYVRFASKKPPFILRQMPSLHVGVMRPLKADVKKHFMERNTIHYVFLPKAFDPDQWPNIAVECHARYPGFLRSERDQYEGRYKFRFDCKEKVNIERVLKAFAHYLSVNPDDIDAIYQQAKTFEIIGDYVAALVCYEKILQIKPRSLSALLAKLQLFTVYAPDLEVALQFCWHYGELFVLMKLKGGCETGVAILKTAGLILQRMGQYRLALQCFKNVRQVSYGEGSVSYDIANLFAQLGYLQNAISEMDGWSAEYSSAGNYHRDLLHAVCCYKNGDFNAAKVCCLGGGDANNIYQVERLYLLGVLLQRVDKDGEAAQKWRQALEMCDKVPQENYDVVIWHWRGIILAALDCDVEAIVVLKRALAEYGELLIRQPNDFAVLRNRAFLFDDLGFVKEALSDLERCAQLQPDDITTLYCLTLVREKMGQTVIAHQLLNRIWEINPYFYINCVEPDLQFMHIALPRIINRHEFSGVEPENLEMVAGTSAYFEEYNDYSSEDEDEHFVRMDWGRYSRFLFPRQLVSEPQPEAHSLPSP